MNDQEVRIAVWAVAWAAGAYKPRWERHVAGQPLTGGEPVPGVAARRGADDRVKSTQARVERFLQEQHGGFTYDEAWGYHGPFGSTRVFVSVRHVLETSTAVLVASPVLSGVELTDALALDVAEVAAARSFGRFAYAAERSELWAELADARRRPRPRGAGGGDHRGRRAGRRRGRPAAGRPRRPPLRRPDRLARSTTARRAASRRLRPAQSSTSGG